MPGEVQTGRQTGTGRHTHGGGRGGARLKIGDQGTHGAHRKHGFHGRDLGRVEAQRLIERPRALSSHKEGIMMRSKGAQRAGGGPGLGANGTCTGRAPDYRAQLAERTQNMDNIVATLDVSKLSG